MDNILNNTEKSGETNKQHKGNSSTELVEQIAVPNTPFTLNRIDQIWFVSMGKYRISEPLKTKDEAAENAESTDWFRILQVIKIMIEENKIIDAQKALMANVAKKPHEPDTFDQMQETEEVKAKNYTDKVIKDLQIAAAKPTKK